MNTDTATTPSSVQAKTEDLMASLERRIAGFSYHRDRFSGISQRLSVILAILAALNTLVVALNEAGITAWGWANFGVVALVVSAMISVAAAYESSTQTRNKAIKNAEGLNHVQDIKARLEWRAMRTETPMTHDEIDAYHTEYRAALKQFFGDFATIGQKDS